MAATQWPLEIVEHITNSLGYDVFADWEEKERLRATLCSCTLVSHRFYAAARRELWKDLPFFYAPFHPAAGLNRRVERLHRVFVENPALRYEVRTVSLGLVPGDPDILFGDGKEDDESERPIGDITQAPSFIGICKVLTLLASANVEKLHLKSERLSMASDSGLDMQDLDNELLFCLTALRCTPSLKEYHLDFLNSPPPSLTFGDPATDTVQKVSVLCVQWGTTGAAYKDITVPRDSPCLDISDDAYARTLRAVENSKLPLPLLTRVTHLILSPVSPFWDALQSHLKVPGSASGWNGHLPTLQYFFPCREVEGKEKGAYLAIHTKPTIQRIRVVEDMGREWLNKLNFDNLPNLHQLDILLDMVEPELGWSRHSRLERFLCAVAPMLQAVPVSQALDALHIECAFFTLTSGECQDLLHPRQGWPILDDALLRLVSGRKPEERPLVVDLSFKLVFGRIFSTWRDDPSEAAGLRKVVEMASTVLPNAARTSTIDLKITTDLLGVGGYPSHVLRVFSGIS